MEPTTDFIALDPNMLYRMEHPQPMANVPNLVGAIVPSTLEAAMANEPFRL